MNLIKNNWLPFVVGVLFALFILPMLQGFVASRRTPAGAR